MQVITLRNIPEEIAKLIERRAAESGLSLNKTVIRLLQERVEIERGGPQEFHDLDHLAGRWTEQEAREFERGLVEDRVIDPEVWE